MTLDADPEISFADFVQDIIPNCSDPHWAKQSQVVPAAAWEYMNFIGDFDQIQEDTRRMLKRIGAWEKYGKSGWSPGAIFEVNRVASQGGEVSGKSRLDEFYDFGKSGEDEAPSNLLDEVKAYYAADYDLLFVPGT